MLLIARNTINYFLEAFVSSLAVFFCFFFNHLDAVYLISCEMTAVFNDMDVHAKK
jgi:hypothetical protein